MTKLKKIVRSVYSSLGLGRKLRLLMRALAGRKETLFFVNALYNRLSYSHKRGWHRRFAKVFRDTDTQAARFNWTVSFLNKKLDIPLGGDLSWLNWDCALSILGHEVEIKQTYETFIKAFGEKLVFFDIGANYGSHSLLFLSHKIKSVAFEPNPRCADYFKQLCHVNHLTPHLEPIALSNENKKVYLSFPKTETWLGTILDSQKTKFKETAEVINLEVEAKTLDTFVKETGTVPGLIKIDTEGNELMVLAGGHETLSQYKPPIIFESFQDDSRQKLWDFFAKYQYSLHGLPILSVNGNQPMDLIAFESDTGTNFIALPPGYKRV